MRQGKQAMFSVKDMYAFQEAAAKGHLTVLDDLMQRAATNAIKQDLLAADNFGAFRLAAWNGHLPIVNYLLEHAAMDEIKQAMLAVDNFGAFRCAVGKGYQHIVQYIMDYVTPEILNTILLEHGVSAFRVFLRDVNNSLAERLLHAPHILAYAESHLREYGAFVFLFIQKALLELQERTMALSLTGPNTVFDEVDAEKTKLYFYMLRHLIRRNHEQQHLDEMRFLLDIPALRRIAHTDARGQESNELLRLALTLNEPEVAAILLNIPDIRVLAEANNYYRQEQRGQLDLAALAHDRESSMRALSRLEQKRLEDAIVVYQPMIKHAGVPYFMDDLRQTLASRYQVNPAFLERTAGGKTPLPMDWDDFIALNLSSTEQKDALKAYYQHKDHTAWRYLSKPNRWMAADASYVYVDKHSPDMRWSTFEEYQPLIVMFYLAAKDEGCPPIDDFTLETRLEHFIEELALIGRAHNWDDTRPIYKDEGQTIAQEEYDNLQGDKPSCYSGVKRRLFQ